MQIKAYSAAEKSCSQVLQVDPENVKALFRKGKVLAGKGETENALVYIKKADQLDPGNKVSFFAVPRALPLSPPTKTKREKKLNFVEIVK